MRFSVAIVASLAASQQTVSTDCSARSTEPRQSPAVTQTAHIACFVGAGRRTTIMLVSVVVVALFNASQETVTTDGRTRACRPGEPGQSPAVALAAHIAGFRITAGRAAVVIVGVAVVALLSSSQQTVAADCRARSVDPRQSPAIACTA